MILDLLDNSSRYLSLHNGFAQSFAFLSRPDLCDLPVGKYEIDGERIFAVIAKAQGREKTGALLETHEKYIDIQFILEGTDTMGWKSKVHCTGPAQDYDPVSDIQFFQDKPVNWVAVHAGLFAIFFPEDAHLPLISSGQIHKVVVKVAIGIS